MVKTDERDLLFNFTKHVTRQRVSKRVQSFFMDDLDATSSESSQKDELPQPTLAKKPSIYDAENDPLKKLTLKPFYWLMQ